MMPWVRLRTQYRHWAGRRALGRRWRYDGSVFDGFQARSSPEQRPVRSVVVTLGTQKGYPFVRLVERMAQIVPEGVEVRWQVGPDFPDDERPAGARGLMTVDEMDAWVAAADAVVAHAGVGSALRLLHKGTTPVLVPRVAEHGEHVDDHQILIGAELAGRGLAVVATPDELSWEHVLASTRTRAVRAPVEQRG